MLDLPAIKKLCEAATKGPWEWKNGDEKRGGFTLHKRVLRSKTAKNEYVKSMPQQILEHISWYVAPNEADAEFIAAARTNVPMLAAALQEAQGKLGAIEEAAAISPSLPASTILAILGENQ